MKRVSKLLLGLAIAAMGIGLFSGAAIAANKNQDVRLGANETYNGFYLHRGQVITVDGTVNGDVLLAGNTVTINGTVNGSVYAVGQTVTIHGKVSGNIHAAASTVEIDGNVGGSLYAAGATVRVDKNVTVNGGVMAAGSSVVLDNQVKGQVYAAGSTVEVNNAVGSDVTLAATQVTVGQGASINGNLKYYSNNNAHIDNDTKITGAISRQNPPQKKSASILGRLGGALFTVVAWFIIGLILIALLPASFVAVSDVINTHPLRAFFTGLVYVLVVPLVLLIVLITVVGIPLAIVAGLLYVVSLMLAYLFVSLWFGRFVLGYRDLEVGHNILALLLGLVVLELVRLVPIVGPIIGVLAFFFGVGALISYLGEHGWRAHHAQTGKSARA